jgi:membrane protease subunit HflK
MTAASAPSRKQSFIRRLIPGLVALVVLAWLASGIYTVGTDEVGVVTQFGKLRNAALRPGIHYCLPWPIEQAVTPRVTDVKRLEVGFKMFGDLWSEPRRSDILTGDENILKVMMVVQYKISDAEKYLFRAAEPDWLVERAVDTAMSVKLAGLPVDDVLTTAKGEIQVDTIREAQHLLDSYSSGIRLVGGNLQTVDPPYPVRDAFKDVASAKKDSERMIDDARGYESSVLPWANGEAQRIISEADGVYAQRVNRALGEADRFTRVLAEYEQAKTVTRTRLYLDAMEKVLSGMRVIIPDRNKITIVDEPQ